MKLNVIKNVEKQMNFVMFLVNTMVPVVACSFVMIFLQGTRKDFIVLLMLLVNILVKIFEKKLGRLAKYIYVCILPAIGPIVIVFANDGKFGAMTQAYFLYLLLSVAYYDKSVVLVNAIVTVAVNAISILLFLDSFLLMHNIPIWIFVFAVFSLAIVTAYVISSNTYRLFRTVEAKEEGMTVLIDNVKDAFENLEHSSADIYNSLDAFSDLSLKIVDFTTKISSDSDMQTEEVNSTLNI